MVKRSDNHNSNNHNYRSFFTTMIMRLLLASTASASASETDQLLQPHISSARTLLQAQQGCPINFENLNYTIITNTCKGPRYPPNICCQAFKDFACPYANQLDDETNNCATTMFSYINLYGHYPSGLFADECRDSKRGLECTESHSSSDHNNTATSAAAASTIAYHRLHWSISLYLLFFCCFLH